MSRENVEVARRAVEAAWSKPRPDFDTINALFHPDHELVSLVNFRQEGQRGAQGFREWLSNQNEAFESWEARIEQVKAVDATRVLLIASVTVQGRTSGIPYEQRMGVVMTVQDGKVTRTETYSSAEEAVEALGLSE